MEYRLNEEGCPHCGNQALELKNNKQSKSIWKQLFAWLKCRNENMLLKFYYRAHSKKMVKEMPVSFSKEWECPACGSKYHDPEELGEKIQKYENLAAGVMAAWAVYTISVIGLMHTVEKAAEILVKMLSMRPDKLQTITTQNFRDLGRDFNVVLPEKFL